MFACAWYASTSPSAGPAGASCSSLASYHRTDSVEGFKLVLLSHHMCTACFRMSRPHDIHSVVSEGKWLRSADFAAIIYLMKCNIPSSLANFLAVLPKDLVSFFAYYFAQYLETLALELTYCLATQLFARLRGRHRSTVYLLRTVHAHSLAGSGELIHTSACTASLRSPRIIRASVHGNGFRAR